MRQLSNLDAQFLAVEDERTPGHVSALSVLTTAGAPAVVTLEAVRELVASRLHLLRPFRERVATVPWGLAHPFWIEDGTFDLDYHVREIALPSPGDDQQLAKQIARIHSRPLDRSRPLWELYLVHGLQGGRLGLLTKVHHAAIDGASGLELLGALLDRSPRTPCAGPRFQPVPRQPPSGLKLLARGLASLPMQPVRAARAVPTVMPNLDQMLMTRALPGVAQLSSAVRGVARIAAQPAVEGDELERPRMRAPRTVLNGRISAQRRLAFASVALDDVERIKHRFETTVNDVVVAVVSSALRAWLLERDELPGEPLLGMIPVSVQASASSADSANRLSTMIVPIPTDEADPCRRLAVAHGTLRSAKARHRTVRSTLLQDANEFIPPMVFGRTSRVIAGLAARSSLEPPCNVVISNVAGPQVPLHFAGARLESMFPLSAIVDGIGLNVTVLSYDGGLHFGIVADDLQMPDPWSLAEAMPAAVEELLALTPVA